MDPVARWIRLTTQRFTPHAVERGGGQLKLPGFGLERTRITPALPLALYDLGGGSSMERGRGAPLALRLWVESILAVGLTDRANPWPTVLEIPLRELLAKLYPGKRRPKPNEYWPRIMQAVEILDSTRIPWEDPETGKGGLHILKRLSRSTPSSLASRPRATRQAPVFLRGPLWGASRMEGHRPGRPKLQAQSGADRLPVPKLDVEVGDRLARAGFDLNAPWRGVARA